MASYTALPCRRPDVVLRDLPPEAMLYDPVGDKVVRLNSTSRRIWELCDGRNSESQISTQIREEFQVGQEVNVERDVATTLQAFAGAGLFQMP